MKKDGTQALRRRGRWRLAARAGGVLAAAWLAVNLGTGYVAAHPGQTDLIWDPPRHEGALAAALGGETVETDQVRGHFVPATNPRAGNLVLVHGYNGSIDSEPLVKVARHFHNSGYGILTINLGYRDGRHRYSGGDREADDISAAIDWLHHHHDEAVTAVWGFSAGAHAALVAATRDPQVPAVVADSGFADASAQIRRIAGGTLHLPDGLFALTPRLVDLFSGNTPIDLLELDWANTPTLVFGGLHDHTVPPKDAAAIANHTGGRLVTLPVNHTRGILDSRAHYLDSATEFLEENETQLGG